jgi:hypothetical protein
MRENDHPERENSYKEFAPVIFLSENSGFL